MRTTERPAACFQVLFLVILGITWTALLGGATAQANPEPQLQNLISTREEQAQTLEKDITRMEKLPQDPIVIEQIELKKQGLARLKAGTASLKRAAENQVSAEDEAFIGTVGEVLRLAGTPATDSGSNQASDSLEPRLSEAKPQALTNAVISIAHSSESR